MPCGQGQNCLEKQLREDNNDHVTVRAAPRALSLPHANERKKIPKMSNSKPEKDLGTVEKKIVLNLYFVVKNIILYPSDKSNEWALSEASLCGQNAIKQACVE